MFFISSQTKVTTTGLRVTHLIVFAWQFYVWQENTMTRPKSWHTVYHSPHSIWRCYHAQPSPCWSEANLPTPPCRILGIAAHRAAVMCHLAPGSIGQELSLTSPLKLVCHRAPHWGESLRATCVHSQDEDRPEGDCQHLLGKLGLPLPLSRLISCLAPRTMQLQIKDCPFGRQPREHSVPPCPITNNHKL